MRRVIAFAAIGSLAFAIIGDRGLPAAPPPSRDVQDMVSAAFLTEFPGLETGDEVLVALTLIRVDGGGQLEGVLSAVTNTQICLKSHPKDAAAKASGEKDQTFWIQRSSIAYIVRKDASPKNATAQP